jgi:hypothetical protein
MDDVGNGERHKLALERQRHWREDPVGRRTRIAEITRLLNGNAADVTAGYDRSRSSGLYGLKRRAACGVRGDVYFEEV